MCRATGSARRSSWHWQWPRPVSTRRPRSRPTKRCGASRRRYRRSRSEEHTSELQSLAYLVCRLLLEKKKKEIIPEEDNDLKKTTTSYSKQILISVDCRQDRVVKYDTALHTRIVAKTSTTIGELHQSML